MSTHFSDLEGKVVIVTGAAGGLGSKCALELARNGVKLGLFDMHPDIEKTAREVQAEKGMENNVLHKKGDVCSLDTDRSFADSVYSAFGRIDGLLNIAAIYRGLKHTSLFDLTEKEWDNTMAVNVKGSWLMSKAVAPFMMKNKRGKIINISSTTVLSGTPQIMHYITSKAAVVGLTRAMARELGGDNIQVNCVSPGILPTEASLERLPDAYMEKLASESSLKRITPPEGVISTLAFLLSDASDYITGQTIVVDSGRYFL